MKVVAFLSSFFLLFLFCGNQSHACKLSIQTSEVNTVHCLDNSQDNVNDENKNSILFEDIDLEDEDDFLSSDNDKNRNSQKNNLTRNFPLIGWDIKATSHSLAACFINKAESTSPDSWYSNYLYLSFCVLRI